MPEPILRPGSLNSRLWQRFSDRWPPVLALVSLVALVIVAALAPFLSQDRPIYIGEDGGGWSSPFFRSFAVIDWAWLGGFLTFLAAFAVLRLSAHKKWATLATATTTLIFLSIVAGIISQCEPVHERRRYRLEQMERRHLLEFDQTIAAGKVAKKDLIDRGENLAEIMGGSQLVVLALYERLNYLQSEKNNDADFIRMAKKNQTELARLDDAIFPLNRFDPNQPSTSSLSLPSKAHKLGSDELGRDVLARLIYGSRTTLTVALGASFLVALFGLFFGLVGGYFGGIVDRFLSRMTEMVLCLPALVILVAAPAWLSREWRQSTVALVLFLGFVLWPQAARLVRNEVRKTKEQDHIRSAIALGLKNHQIILRHLLPNIVPPLLVSVGLTAGNLILLESTLSFLGLGPSDQPSWGRMLAEARNASVIGEVWHMAILPGVAVVICMFIFNSLSQSLERAMNPKRES